MALFFPVRAQLGNSTGAARGYHGDQPMYRPLYVAKCVLPGSRSKRVRDPWGGCACILGPGWHACSHCSGLLHLPGGGERDCLLLPCTTLLGDLTRRFCNVCMHSCLPWHEHIAVLWNCIVCCQIVPHSAVKLSCIVKQTSPVIFTESVCPYNIRVALQELISVRMTSCAGGAANVCRCGAAS